MNIWESRVHFRPRSGFEAADLGLGLFRERPWLYIGLWATFSLPVYGLLVLLCWNVPFLATVLIWWLKPVFEAPLVQVLSQQVFAEPPAYRVCVRDTFRLLWRRRLLGDLLWRRFGMRRSLVVPAVLLEDLPDKMCGRRFGELSRHSGAMAGWLAFFGIHLETLMVYALMLAGFLFWFEDPTSTVVATPFGNYQAYRFFEQLGEWLVIDEGRTVELVGNAAYILVLCFWQPMYVAAGFGLYLNARTQAEGWDIRLAARKMQERLNGKQSALWSVLLLSACFGFGFSGSLKAEPLPRIPEIEQEERRDAGSFLSVDDDVEREAAETPPLREDGGSLAAQGQTVAVPRSEAGLPNADKVEEIRATVLSEAPFPHIASETEYCWISCDRQTAPLSLFEGERLPAAPAAWFNPLMMVLVAVLVAAVIYFLLRWSRNGVGLGGSEEVPETLFGMNLRPESLPADVAAAVLARFDSDPRAAVSLLYRASLSQVGHRYGLPLRASDTEGQVLRRVRRRQTGLVAYWTDLTAVWVALAYAHRLPERAAVEALCRQYRQVFAAATATVRQAEGAAGHA